MSEQTNAIAQQRLELDRELELGRLDLERRSTEATIRQRDRELEAEAERLRIDSERLDLEREHSSPFHNPVVLGIAAAFIGLLSNAFVAGINTYMERDLTETRSIAQHELEKSKAESARILEALKSGGDVTKAEENLRLLAKTGLVPTHEDELIAYLDDLESRREKTGNPELGPGIGPTGPVAFKRIPDAERLDELEEAEPSLVSPGDDGPAVKRVQEWLGLAGFETPQNGIYDPTTQEALRQFAENAGVRFDGVVTEQLDRALKAPLIQATTIPDDAPSSFPALLAMLARQHAAAGARELHESNVGPWVRYYCDGWHGRNYYWGGCFISRLIKDSAAALGTDPPIPFTESFDQLAADADERGLLFFPDVDGSWSPKPGDVMLLRRSKNDYVHGGIVVSVGTEIVRTIEGNTNAVGSRIGKEVVLRTRSRGLRSKIAFIRFSGTSE